ncbi:MAG: DMT family transporter [Saprospiraceae bacterium]
MNWKIILLGLTFSVLWASASTATKIGLQVAQPFVISISRFFIAGLIMLFISHVIRRNRMPEKSEWRQLMIFGVLNISVYLGLYIIAMQYISAGLGSLFIAVNPVMISFIGAGLFGHRITLINIISLSLCIAGVILAALPLLQNSYATTGGLLLMVVAMLAYSLGTIYFTRKTWSNLHVLTINGWQTFLGGVFLLPLLLMTYKEQQNTFDMHFWGGTLWLAGPVSIIAVLCWLQLLNKTPLTAAYWLFLCPIFGFLISNITLNEPLSLFTLWGVILVIAGLFLVQRYNKTELVPQASFLTQQKVKVKT